MLTPIPHEFAIGGVYLPPMLVAAAFGLLAAQLGNSGLHLMRLRVGRTDCIPRKLVRPARVVKVDGHELTRAIWQHGHGLRHVVQIIRMQIMLLKARFKAARPFGKPLAGFGKVYRAGMVALHGLRIRIAMRAGQNLLQLLGG